MREELTVMEQLHMAALLTNTNNPRCEIDYMDTNGGTKTINGSILYFTNTTVCLKDGRLINIKDIRKISC